MESIQVSSETSTPTNQPDIADLGNIAVSFSGGGYRASAYHLGALDLLHKVGLLDKVTMLSTVSGGTIVGAKYAHSLSQAVHDGRQNFFEDFYDEFCQFILETRLPDLWLERLHPENTDRPSLIAAAADVYDERLFKGARFDQLIAAKPKMHLKEIIFNTTELRTGIDFRFRISPGGQIGNYYVPISEELLAEVRLADVVAGSSCFPGGFEPIIFPDDFKFKSDWQTVKKTLETRYEEQKTAKPYLEALFAKLLHTLDSITEEPLPIVDGGIYDNFGTDALFVADDRFKRRKEHDQRFGTLIISETDNIGVATDTDDIEKRASLLKLSFPIAGNALNRITVKQLVTVIRGSFALLLISTIAFALSALATFVEAEEITFQGILAIWASIVFAGLTAIFSTINSFFIRLSTIPDNNEPKPPKQGFIANMQEIIVDWKSFLKTGGNLSIVDLMNMLGLRLVSLSSLFLALLKGQRRQSYEFMDELRKTDILARKLRQKYGSLEELEDCKKINIINNFILGTVERSWRFWEQRYQFSVPNYLIPSSEMVKIAIDAAQTPTTLWFDENPAQAKKDLDTVIACGQFTTCFTLLRLIEEIANRPNTTLSPQMEEVRQRAQAAWQQFQKNPQIWVGDNRKQAIVDFQK